MATESSITGITAALRKAALLLATRLLSLRAYDEGGMMVDADVVEGRELRGHIKRFFENDAVAYIHAHFARRGCYAARIERA
jgi:hypothetical protein